MEFNIREIDIIGIIACISMIGVIVAFVAINSMEKQIDWLMEKFVAKPQQKEEK